MRKRRSWIALGACSLLGLGLFIADRMGLGEGVAYSLTGKASWYEGGPVASGGSYVDGDFAAMRDVPMGTRVRVINLENKRSVVLTVNDRGPNAALAAKGRVIDLTRRAFLKLTGKVHADIVKVRVEILKKKELNRP